ncbi:MAG: alpha,6-mannosyltransferase [Solirubrobacterales bacterium]|nr:alpha,6-mannosyltransferase [Solirubrobacterales bacterium]
MPRPPTPSPADRARGLAGWIALAAIVAASWWMAAGAAAHPAFVLVRANHGGYPAALRGPLEGIGVPLGPGGFVALLLVASIAYLVVLWAAAALPRRAVFGAIVAAVLAMTLAPPLLSSDVFNYIGYARLDVLHGLNPYQHALDAAPSDAAFAYVGWQHSTSAYGPLFTLLTLPLAKLGLTGALWTLKALTAAAALACIALAAGCAKRVGRDPLAAALFVGLNPIFLVFAVGGAHNDLLMMALALAGVYALLGRREAVGAAAVTTAAAVKTSAALLAPFAILGARHRGRALVAVLAAAATFALLALAVFGSHLFSVVRVLGDEAHAGSLHSLPKSIASISGIDIAVLRPLGTAIALAAIAALLWQAARDRTAWLGAAAWATIAVLATTTYMLPWYLIWALPLAAIAAPPQRGWRLGDQRLWALALCAFVIALRIPTIA